jgi:L,D-transpeptidase YcbB
MQTLLASMFPPRITSRLVTGSLFLILAVLLNSEVRVYPEEASLREALRARVETLRLSKTAPIRGVRLWQSAAVAAFFEARGFESAWAIPAGAESIMHAIREIQQDGLAPADYHLMVIESALIARSKAPAVDVDADLQVLLADAAAALVDHVRYGRVTPVSLDRRWNVDPRAEAPALQTVLQTLAASAAPGDTIESLKPNEFIYVGLK